MTKVLFILILSLSFVSCDTFTGCGPIIAIGAPEMRYRQQMIGGSTVNLQTGEYYYPITIKGDDGRNHKIYVSYYTWLTSHPGEIFCVE